MSSQEKNNLIREIEAALDHVRPHLEADGGNVEVVDVTDDMTVQVKWTGNCENCHMALITMKAGIEQAIKNRIPAIRHIEAVNGLEVG
jgi:Fe-S cluster biogenesis protein NfuA